jgi:hypothetical protein
MSRVTKPVDPMKVVWTPRQAHAVSPARVAMGLLYLLIAIASIVGVVATLSMGQTNVAIIIGLVSSAFFISLATC